MKKSAYYFPHDTNAQSDERIVHLMSVMDWAGYGLYWGIIERLHDSADGWLDNDSPRIAFALHSHPSIVNQVINDFGLFKFNEKKFTSDRVQRNLRERRKKSEHGKKAANYRHHKALTEDARAMPEQCSPNAIKERKGKERKLKESNNDRFEIIWNKYPKRIGKKNALRHFESTVKTEEDFLAIQKALDNYISSERVSNGFIQNGSTWLNQWADWIDFKEKVCQKCKNKGKYTSSTGYEIICDCARGKK